MWLLHNWFNRVHEVTMELEQLLAFMVNFIGYAIDNNIDLYKRVNNVQSNQQCGSLWRF